MNEEDPNYKDIIQLLRKVKSRPVEGDTKPVFEKLEPNPLMGLVKMSPATQFTQSNED